MKTFTGDYQKSVLINLWLFVVYSGSTGPAEVIFDGTGINPKLDFISPDTEQQKTKDVITINNNNKLNPLFRLILVAVFSLSTLFFTQNIFAQTANLYSFSTVGTGSFASDRTGNVVDMTTGTTQLVGANQDDASSSITGIGFSFTFFSTIYTQFSASSNGAIRLGGSAISSTTYGNSFPISSQAIIAPYMQDLATSSSGKVHYKLVGSYPNRTLVVEFLNMEINYSSGTVDGTFQARLYEQTNTIEFVYGAMKVNGTTNTNSRIAAIGFSNTTGTNNEFSVNQSSFATTTASTPITNNNSSTGTITGLNSTADGSRRVFTFVPTVAYKSQFISMNTGVATWCPGEIRIITVTVKNVGSATWTDGAPDVNIGVKWNTNGANWTDYHVRTDAGNLAPGSTATYSLPVTASNNPGSGYTTPLSNGSNNLIFDIVNEGNCWFGNNNGSCGPGNSVYTSSTITINSSNIPAQPGAINGSINPCSGSSQTYTVPNVAGVNYNWAFPSGWVQTGGGTANSVIVTAGSGSGNITVTPSNSCGNGAPQILTVSILSLSVSVTNKTDITCFGRNDGTITISASGGTGPYQFSVDNGDNYIAGTNPYTFSELSANIQYKIRVKDSNGCESPAILP